ncbi:hypothetical protein V6N13_091462 [Hibiscus sabdariffa]
MKEAVVMDAHMMAIFGSMVWGFQPTTTVGVTKVEAPMRSREVFWQKNQLWEDMIDACRQEGMVSVKIDEVEGGGSQEGSILCCMNILRHDMMDVPSNIG